MLLPLPADQASIAALLPASASARGGVLLPQPLFATDSSSAGMAYTDLRVVAFRLDPCFGQACDNQLRLVFQPVTWDPTNQVATAEDGAVHAFYHLTREELLAAIDDLVAARIADGGTSDLGALAPNPIIAREGVGGALAASYAAIVTKYAGEQNLVCMTSLLVDRPVHPAPTTGVVQAWTLHGFDITGGSATPIAIATLPNGATQLSILAQPLPLSSELSPQTTSTDNINVLVSFSTAMQATADVRQAAFDAALRIENPRDHSPDTIDCASCHMAEPSRVLVGEALGLSASGNPNAFVADRSTTQLVASDGVLNIHAFSYRGAEPMINQRVINETTANLAYVKTLR